MSAWKPDPMLASMAYHAETGRVFVCDGKGGVVREFDAAAAAASTTQGEKLAAVAGLTSVSVRGGADATAPPVRCPCGVACDPRPGGCVAVADRASPRLVILARPGATGAAAEGAPAPGLGDWAFVRELPGKLKQPAGCAWDAARKRLYTCDAKNHRLQARCKRNKIKRRLQRRIILR